MENSYTHRVEWTETLTTTGYRGTVTKGFKTTADAVPLHRAQFERRVARGNVLSYSIEALA